MRFCIVYLLVVMIHSWYRVCLEEWEVPKKVWGAAPAVYKASHAVMAIVRPVVLARCSLNLFLPTDHPHHYQ